jgi:hypothetical protein
VAKKTPSFRVGTDVAELIRRVWVRSMREAAERATVGKARWGVSLARLTLLASALATGCVGEMGQPGGVDVCHPRTTRSCTCDDGDSGVQACTDEGDAWDECRCSCAPGENRHCTDEAGQPGMKSCDVSGTFWSPCGPLDDGQGDEQPEDPRCSLGMTYCPAVGCISLSNSATNCGACGRSCEGCDQCIRGECTVVCCTPEVNCGSIRVPFCSDLQSDPENCGECGLQCTEGEVCVQGDCLG